MFATLTEVEQHTLAGYLYSAVMKSSRLTAYVVKYDDLYKPARDLMNEMGELHSELHEEICHPTRAAALPNRWLQRVGLPADVR